MEFQQQNLLMTAQGRATRSLCRRTMPTSPETDAWFCHNGTSETDRKQLPWPSPGRREWVGSRCCVREGQSGWTGLGAASSVQVPASQSGAGDVRLLFKAGFSSKLEDDTPICLLSAPKDTYGGEVKAKRKTKGESGQTKRTL